MNKPKHTPGPWWVTDSGVRDAGGYICHFNSVTRYPDQDERYEREVAECAANKDLIAAAPELLKTLQSFVFEFGDKTDSATVNKARAAIRKALGEAA